MNSTRFHAPLVLAYASALSLCCFTFQWRRKGGDQTSDENDEVSENYTNDMEIHFMPTFRNKKIFGSAIGLHIQPWGFTNRHFASLLAQVRPSPFLIHRGIATRKIEKIPSPSGCHIEVEFFNPSSPVSRHAPTIIILHGVGGHSREVYVEQAAIQIVKKGWRAVVLNYSKISITQEGSVGGNCLTESHDISLLVSHLRKRHCGFLGAIGFSMGGTKLANYILRTKEHCNLDAACTISSPLDFTIDNDTVHEPHANFVTSIYHFIVSSHLKLWMLKNYNVLRKHHSFQSSSLLDLSFWFTHLSVPEIDRAITMPLKGRRESDLMNYYIEASSLRTLGDGLKIPFMCITAMNDPFIPPPVIPGREMAYSNQNIFVVNTKCGGHIGYWRPEVGCWATNAAISFFDSVKVNSNQAFKSKYLRQAGSLDAAHSLQKSSTTGLTNYFDFVDLDSCSDLMDEDALKSLNRDRFVPYTESTIDVKKML